MPIKTAISTNHRAIKKYAEAAVGHRQQLFLFLILPQTKYFPFWEVLDSGLSKPMTQRYLFLFFIIFFLSVGAKGQHKALVKGQVSDEKGKSIELAHVTLPNGKEGVTTDSRGRYEIRVPADTTIELTFSFLGFRHATSTLKLRPGEIRILNISLIQVASDLPTAEVHGARSAVGSISKISPKAARELPSFSSGIEDLIKTLPGVSSNNELSSQYTVRGGNFDENLVYVNGIEIYRPFLIRSGQQEGLSFLNPGMISGISFSAGGFSAEYGDKLSSALDITYKNPTENGGAVALSLLGAELNVEGINKKRNLTYLAGARYRTTQYILNALETQGQYRPDFIDIQSLLTFRPSLKWDFSLLGYYARNNYKLIPETRQTSFGTLSEAYRLMVYFDGQEVDRFETGMGAATLSFRPHNNLDLRLIASAYNSIESEAYDIEGQYWIGKLENSLGSEEFGNVVQSQGVGAFLDHARNAFRASVASIEHKGTLAAGRNIIKWGARYQLQQINDKLSEWEMIDSAGFTLPRPVEIPGQADPLHSDLLLNQVARANHRLHSNNFNAYLQNSWNLVSANQHEWSFTAGIRTNYWGYGNEWTISPRFSASVKPNWEKDFHFRFSAGVYTQPPYYREMRLFNGQLYNHPQSQISYQAIAAADYRFFAWRRPFVFTSEVYYKYFDRLIPYEVDNVRLRYYADQLSVGYAAGLDMKVNGEFVKGIESWASFSLMKTKEDVIGDHYTYYINTDGKRITPQSINQTIADSVTVFPGFIPRPTDQRFQFALFFQDYIPNYPTFKVHLKLVFGARLPFGQPNTERYLQTRRMPEYRRVDIGFSKQLLGEDRNPSRMAVLNEIKNMWVSLEVFNLLQISNTISYLWVKDVNNIQYGVPNFLTPRQLNLKLVMEF